MANATFSFHGALAQFLARERRGGAFACDCARAATLKHAIESVGVPHTEVGALTVNQQPATLARIVREGDVVEVFPHAPGAPGTAADPMFLADAHLGGLARMLRMLGFDTLYDNAIGDREIVAIAEREPRIVLTRDRELLKRREILRGCFVHARKPEAQLKEVARRYALARCARPFTLCLHCNLGLAPVAKPLTAGRVPERIRETYDRYTRCPGCARIYWEGSHWARMRTLLEDALDLSLEPGPGG